MPSNTPAPLLIAEDDANDMFLFTRLLKAAGATHALHIALDGQDAIQLLSPVVKKNRLVEKPLMVFLDLKMPRVGGLAVLEWLRSQRELDDIPVVIMSGATVPDEIRRARELGAQCYLAKYPAKMTIIRVLEYGADFAGRSTTTLFDLPDNLLLTARGR